MEGRREGWKVGYGCKRRIEVRKFLPPFRFLLKVPHTSPSDIVTSSANLR